MTGLLPLTHADLASHHGVRAPKAIILFGPPGTGKTTFAKAIASQLGLPFVELFPSQLASAGVGGQAAALRTFFKRVIEADEPIDLDELVRASAQFTPADIDFAARKGAQMAFERSIIGPRTNRSTLEDFLAAIDDTSNPDASDGPRVRDRHRRLRPDVAGRLALSRLPFSR